jgi:spermidine synthase
MGVRNRQAPIVEQTISPALRRYLYATAAITGAAIMIIEILGAKMLAPFVGTSHFVWTAQIAITLMALAAGYYAGGRTVDQSPRLNRLYACILGAGFYLAFTIPMVEPVAYRCLLYKLPLGTLLASGFLYFVPLALLAMVGPFLVRMLTSSVLSVGANIGRLTAISTLGSFAGTVLIGYVLIPFLPNSITMYVTAGILMSVAALYFLVWGRQPVAKGAVLAACAAGLLLGYGGVSKEWTSRLVNADELYRGNSNFGLLQVLQNKAGDRCYYLNDFLIQNTYDPTKRKSMALFTYMLHDLARAYTPRIEDALCIGLGVGIVPSQFAEEGVRVDVVEINPAVVRVATNYFNCDVARLNLSIGDGRYFLNRAAKQYDTVILDAFLGDSSPSHLMTVEAFRSIQRILKENGTLVINSFGEFEGGRDFLVASLHKTLKSAFKQVRIHASGNGNVFFVASDSADLRILLQPDFDTVHIACRDAAREAFAKQPGTDSSHGIVLTDNFNPVEFYDAPNREQHRLRLANLMKSL